MKGVPPGHVVESPTFEPTHISEEGRTEEGHSRLSPLRDVNLAEI